MARRTAKPKKARSAKSSASAASAQRGLRVAITGVNNPILAELAARLDADPQVEALVLFDVIRPTHSFERARFVHVDLTLSDADQRLTEVLEADDIRTFVHGAFLANPARDPNWAHELEAIGSLHALVACAAAGVEHVVLKSTTMVYGARHDNPAFLSEEHPLRGDRGSRWVRDKIEADLQFQRYAAEHSDVVVTIARLATVLAPSVTHYLARFLGRPVVPMHAGYDPLLQFLDLGDAADALSSMLRRPTGGVFNVAPDGVLPLSSVLRLGRRVPLPLPHPLAFTCARLLWRAQLMDVPPRFLDYFRYPWNADGARARQAFGLTPAHTTKEVVCAFYRSTDARSTGPAPSAATATEP